MNNDANLQINSEDIHINTVFLNTVQSNVKCKITNKSPFCQHAPDVTNENRPIRFISRQHPIYIPSHIKCHLKPPISHSENYSSGLRNRTGIQCILCPKIYTFANKLLDVEREKEDFFFHFILTVSLLPYTSFLWFVLERLGDHWLGLEYVSFVKYGLNAKLRMSITWSSNSELVASVLALL